MSSKVKTFQLDQVANALPFPLQVMSVHNAAMDFVAVTNAIKQAGEHFYMMGESYGAFLSSYAYRLAPTLFSGAILDGFNPALHIRGGAEPDLRQPLSAVCTKSIECPSLIDPARILTLVQDVVSTDNHCTRKVFERDSKVSKERAVRGFIRSIKEAFMSVLSQQATVAFLNGAIACANPAQFDSALDKLDKLEREAFEESGRGKDAIIKPDSASKEIKAFTSKDANLLMQLIRYSEKQLDAGTCAPPEYQMLSRCELFDDDYYPRMLKGYLYQPKLPPPYSTAMNQVIVIAAKGDHRTPHDGAQTEYQNMSVGSKSFYSFDYTQHVSLATNTCGNEVMQQLMARDDAELKSAKTKVEACVDDLNAMHFPWLNFDPELRHLWGDAKVDRPVPAGPPQGPARGPRGRVSTTTIVYGVSIALALLFIVVIIVLRVRKSRR